MEPEPEKAAVLVRRGDRDETPSRRLPLVIVLDRLRSAMNTGNILRLADAVAAEEVICCGYTPFPPHAKLEKASMGAESALLLRHAASAAEAAAELRGRGYEIVGVETAAEAESVWTARFPSPVALIFGNEALGISDEALGLCSRFVALPAFGRKNSINVATAAAVVCYEAARQLQAPEARR
ncbi:MAG: hypothetical protein RL095_2275 [Verrucomicrobiota bacterium]|jgi:tRNA G18 (ribose-2'-O)-methylase SpoU